MAWEKRELNRHLLLSMVFGYRNFLKMFSNILFFIWSPSSRWKEKGLASADYFYFESIILNTSIVCLPAERFYKKKYIYIVSSFLIITNTFTSFIKLSIFFKSPRNQIFLSAIQNFFWESGYLYANLTRQIFTTYCVLKRRKNTLFMFPFIWNNLFFNLKKN